MSRKTTSAVDILRHEIIGSDEDRLRELDRERENVEVALQIHAARKNAGLSQKELAARIGTKQSVISRLEDADYDGHSLNMLRRIATALEVRLDVRLGSGVSSCEDNAFGEDADLLEGCPAAELRRRDWIPPYETARELRAILTDFLRSAPKTTTALLRQSGTGEMRLPALVCWLAKLNIEAERMDVGTFDPDPLERELPELARLSAAKDGPLKAVEWLANRGVRCLFVKHLPKTYLDGAAALPEDGSPVTGLTLRYDRLDYFWFTLLHEVGHVILHVDQLQESPIIDENIERASVESREQAANRFANEAWVPQEDWARFRASRRGSAPSKAAVRSFAEQLRVSPALVAGRLRHESRDYSIYQEFLGQGEVRALLAEAGLFY